MLQIGIYTRKTLPFSFRVYRTNMARALEELGVGVTPFGDPARPPAGCDLVWSPGAGLRAMARLAARSSVPVVVTVHGNVAFALDPRDARRGWLGRAELLARRLARTLYWRRLHPRLAAILTVSRYCAAELVRALDLSEQLVHPIHHGVDHALFRPDGPQAQHTRPYLLHISAGNQPKKNVERIFAAYAQLPADGRPDLVAIVPGYQGAAPPAGVTLRRQGLPQEELAPWYRGALAFVFPSLHESFGMPILEAMASGCPVLTSNVTACPEIAGESALLVDPRSTQELATAISRLAREAGLRQALRQQGLARAHDFTWERSATQALRVFQQVAQP